MGSQGWCARKSSSDRNWHERWVGRLALQGKEAAQSKGCRQTLEEPTRSEGHEPVGVPSVIHLKPRQATMRPAPGTPRTVTSHSCHVWSPTSSRRPSLQHGGQRRRKHMLENALPPGGPGCLGCCSQAEGPLLHTRSLSHSPRPPAEHFMGPVRAPNKPGVFLKTSLLCQLPGHPTLEQVT